MTAPPVAGPGVPGPVGDVSYGNARLGEVAYHDLLSEYRQPFWQVARIVGQVGPGTEFVDVWIDGVASSTEPASSVPRWGSDRPGGCRPEPHRSCPQLRLIRNRLATSTAPPRARADDASTTI
ncbi:hypothetical protein BH24ACT5_BH24ACT5_16250 [soil metagenome]